MKAIPRKLLSTLLAVAMVVTLFVAMPMTAGAASSTVTIVQGEGVLVTSQKIQTAISNASPGETVTVTGSKTNFDMGLIEIPSGVTVLWKAACSGNAVDATYGLLTVNGSGTFEVAAGGSIINTGDGPAIRSLGASAAIIVSGGTVSNTGTGDTIYSTGTNNRITVSGGLGENSNGIAILADGANTSITVSGGTVSATGEAPGIFTNGAGATISVSSGTVSAEGRNAIHTEGENSTVNVSGGTVKNTATSNYTSQHTIYLAGDTAVINISGGTVSAWVSAISTSGVINMSGGTVSTTTGTNGHALNGYGGVNMNGGTVSAITGNGIGGRYIKVSGGTVSTETGAAIRSAEEITVSGGTVSATTGYAIEMFNVGSVNVTGGFVFAYAPNISGPNNVIRVNIGALNISDTAVVCAYDKDAGHSEYAEGTTDDLKVSPSAAAVTWGVSGAQHGVNYKNGSNTGFFPVNDVTVNLATPATAAPNIDSADGWARDAIEAAYALGLIPDSLQSNYTTLITRAEYCAIAVRLYELYTGGPITTFSDFSDTGDMNVRKLAGVGVVQGNGDGTFSPNGVFTREQMAAISVNLVETMTGVVIPASNPNFNDMDQAQTWFRPYIGQVQAAGIMQGVGANSFDPKRELDRQSAIMLTLNLYNFL